MGKCPRLDVTFLFMLSGWSADKRGDHYVMVSPRLATERLGAVSGN